MGDKEKDGEDYQPFDNMGNTGALEYEEHLVDYQCEKQNIEYVT